MTIFRSFHEPLITLDVFDIVIIVIFAFVALLLAMMVSHRHSEKEICYKVLPMAVAARILASLVYAAIVCYFYPGDSMAYFRSLNVICNVADQNIGDFFKLLFNGNQPDYYLFFNDTTGFPNYYMWRDHCAIFVARAYIPFAFLFKNSYFVTTLIAGMIGFSGLWKLYVLMCRLYPKLWKVLAFAVLFFPSTLYWSSGIMKDTLTISGLGWIIYCSYYLFIKRKIRLRYIVVIIAASIVVINVKAYIFISLLAGLVVLLFFEYLAKVSNKVFKVMVVPVLVIVLASGTFMIMQSFKSQLGNYGELDTLLEQAQIIQQDLSRSESYGTNMYDIGDFDASISGVIKKIPQALVTGLFRPFLWDATNVFILLSALENTFLLLFTILVLIKIGPIKFFKLIFKDPFLVMALAFSLLFAFGVGLATANFGALVRYKIPLLPFYTSLLFILYDKRKRMQDADSQRLMLETTDYVKN